MSSVDNYIRESNTETWWYPEGAFTDDRAPTAEELNAGTRLTEALAERATMPLGGSTVALLSQASGFVGAIPGTWGGESWGVTLYRKTGDSTIYDMFPRLTKGYLAKSWDHPTEVWAVGDVLDLGQVAVASRNRADSVQYTVEFAVACEPLLDYPVAS